MRSIEVIGTVDAQHRLSAEVPSTVPPGLVKLVVILPAPEEDEAGAAWSEGIAREWAQELSDPREDIYTLEDGEPVDGAR